MEASASRPSPSCRAAAVVAPSGGYSLATARARVHGGDLTTGQSRFFEVIEGLDRASAGTAGDMLSAMGLPRGEAHRCKDGVPPSTIFKVIESQSRSAVDVSAMADSVAKARWHARLERSSSAAYASHLRMIAWGCRVFNIDPVGPGVPGVRRIAACVNNASTLSCWLSAWKCALEGLGASWPGDLDPLLKGIRRGTAKLQTPRMPRQRVRRALLRDLLKVALSKSSTVWYWWAFIGIVAHSFALRMPSELFAQFEFRKLKRSSNQWVYGPIRRKFRVDWQFPCAFCHCEVDPFHVPLCIQRLAVGVSSTSRL